MVSTSPAAVPRLLLGHNALIGVSHRDRAKDHLKRAFGDEDRAFVETAYKLGVRGIVLDSHPVALGAAAYIRDAHPDLRIFPMVPYAQAVVDQASRGGFASLIGGMAATSLGRPLAVARIARDLALGRIAGAGSRAALLHYLVGFPGGFPVCFLHNIVTDLLLGWDALAGLAGFAQAARETGAHPGFVTLNPGAIPRLRAAVGEDAWFMCAVNSRGIQMSPSLEAAEQVLADASYNIVAMSVLGGGFLRPEQEIPRAFAFPAVRSVVIGTTDVGHLAALLETVAKATG